MVILSSISYQTRSAVLYGIPTSSELQQSMRDGMNACATVASASADRYGFKYQIFRKCMNADLHT